MDIWKYDFSDSSILLAVEGSCGGTSLGIQMARQAIIEGNRVLWAAPELPDSTRFSQIFSDVDLSASSRFHAMNLVGNFDQAIDTIIHTANTLPGVSLVILDDFSPNSGRVPKDVTSGVNKLIKSSNWTTLLITKGGVSMGEDSLTARGKSEIKSDEVWLLTRPDSGSKRTLSVSNQKVNLFLKEEGFFQ